MVEVGSFGETAFHDIPEEGGQGLPVAALVDDHDRLAVEAQGPPGEDLEELLQGADAAGQDHEGVGTLEHLQFALVHGLDDHGLGELRMARFALQKEIRDDPDRPAPTVEDGIGDQPHQADAPSAIDQRYILGDQQPAEADGGVAGGRIDPEAGAAEDTKGGGGEFGHESCFSGTIKRVSALV